MLIEGGKRLLSAFAPELSARVLEDLRGLGVDVRLETLVDSIDAEGVRLKDGQRIESNTN